MGQHVIQFNAAISWEGQANFLPPVLHSYLIFDQYDKDVFDKVIDQTLQAFIGRQAFICDREQGQPSDIRQFPANKLLVPFRWIVGITVEVRNLVGEMSTPDSDGVERLTNGEEPSKQ